MKGKNGTPKNLKLWVGKGEKYRFKQGSKVGKKTQFKKGHFVWNKNLKSEHQPNWQGGISTLNKRLRASSMFKIWREAVFLRDNFTCQNKNCGFCNNKNGVMLHAHHIKAWKDFQELRFNINNGITYCAEFHLKSNLHKKIQQLNKEGGK